jgi:hypothetical protein
VSRSGVWSRAKHRGRYGDVHSVSREISFIHYVCEETFMNMMSVV